MEEKKRPIRTSLLAVLHVAGGILGAIGTFFLVVQLGKNPEYQQGFDMLGLPPALLIVAIVFSCGLGIASGMGMWRGRKWGWYLGSFCYMYSIVRGANALATIPILMSSIWEIEYEHI